MKINLKKIVSLSFILIILSSFLVGIFSFKFGVTNASFYDSVFNNIKVTEKNFIKGADLSSYAEVVEQDTYDKGQLKKYNELTEEDQKIFLDFDGEYKNLFEILSNNGLNSIRLRLWKNPSSSDNKTYGGGHNDLDTDIWITNQAKKYGIKNVLLDLHYSDFWADPSRQWIPTDWEELTTEELYNEIYNYTFNLLEKFYKETDLLPSIIQLGNEITYGAFWNIKNNSISGRNDLVQTAKYLEYGLKAVKDIEVRYNKKIIKAIHIDGQPSLPDWSRILDKYLIKGNLKDSVDQIGITYYPDWNGNTIKLFNVMTKIKNDYGLDSYVSETASPYTYTPSTYVGDITSSQYSENQANTKVSSKAQMKLLNAIYETASRALPNSITGVYWWEPAWIMSGKNGWSTREGIIYAEPNSQENQKNFMVGNSWWNRGWFDFNRNAMPVLSVVKNFNRINEQDENIDINLLMNEIYWDPFRDDSILKNTPLRNNNEVWNNKYSIENAISKRNLVLITNENIENNLISEVEKQNPALLNSQIKYSNFSYQENKGSIKITPGNNNFYYKSDEEVVVNFEVAKNETQLLDFTTGKNKIDPIYISSSKFDYSKFLWETLFNSDNSSKTFDKIKQKLVEVIIPEFSAKSNYEFSYENGITFIDKDSKKRWLKPWIFKKSENILKYNNTAIFEELSQKSYWPEKIDSTNKQLTIYFTKEVNFEEYGPEDWKNLKAVGITIPIEFY